MFENLTDRLEGVFKKLRGHGKLTEENIQDAMGEVRMALLEADVNFNVVKQFIATVTEKAVGVEVSQALSPGQQIIKIVHEELVALLGGNTEQIRLDGRQPVIIMMAGLQGSGKTTTSGKLARMLKEKGRRPYLVPADVYRPAAIEQLQILGGKIDVPVHPSTTETKPVDICRQAVAVARAKNYDTLIIDTAGRLHVDELLMGELKEIQAAIRPSEVLFVADAMTGQDAVTVAGKFNEDLEITGVVLTKMEGDARGGAALSIKNVTGKPIKFTGVGEGLDALEIFHPDRTASRILGMGDVLTLIEKAEAVVDKKKADKLINKLRQNTFTLEDFLDQIQQIKKMGSLEQIMAMIPGINKLKQLKDAPQPNEKELSKTEAIIRSMTRKERHNYAIINTSRRQRIASGSGTDVADVNRVIKSYSTMLKMMQKMRGKPGLITGQKRRKLPKGLRKN
ncbi:MAG: signal recognition particle protein [Proteobacteria bacterium]|jgi:signal recognition particle subunit SRP54|nr:signal recognition particle protein [Desulfocapsa sp.]MBU3945696.1 signal recognition particle protein [Pseudomonadota bacterium]MCG2745019.1 signal recognition particle protein [Desulfobacteraceae bacterium]MBU4027414.1 signal recognition particle protein [Pseudomonadota bacterium]MBU4044535.1 signal recognition particle protein [Pseudomonadota bacterium]